MDRKAHLAEALGGARTRTLDLLAPLDDADLRRQHSPIMSPLVWDLAHVGNYEEQWLVRAVADRAPIDPSLDDLYDAFRHPRPNRPALPLLGPVEAQRYLTEVRDRALDVLDDLDLDAPGPLVSDGYVYAMVLQHEHQHDETMLATLQLMDGPGYRPADALHLPGPAEQVRPVDPEAKVSVPGGTYLVGTSTDPSAYDNERPAHTVDLPPFEIDAFPVTNERYLAFIGDGGYREQRWWTAEGWAWKESEAAECPLFWSREGGGSWSRLRFGWREDVPAGEPVQHVSWYEADAFARWAGRRLPTEAEWEVVASAAPDGGRRHYPWGEGPATERHANLWTAAVGAGGRRFGPAPIGSLPSGASSLGVEHMIGDVWEWTSSDFDAYPGFASFPYREYSEVFLGGDYKVLRGGSWATHPGAARNTFRNWDHPVRRQIFSGFRTAKSS